jgi:8-amino-7-oxononanoate synthase
MSRSYGEWLEAAATERNRRGLARTLRTRRSDEDLIDVASNDYLGLATDPRVVDAAVVAAKTWGAGATGSRLVTGTTDCHVDLEKALTEFFDAGAALSFASGYAANLGVVTALGGADTVVISDADNHASLVDACRLSRSRVSVSPHSDVSAVREALANRSEARALVVVDAVFSTDGSLAPLGELHEACQAHDALLVVDEAHSVGVIGSLGHGLVSDAGLAHSPDVIRTITLSKALGSQGGAVLGTPPIVEHLVNAARTFIFDTGLAPAAAGAATAAIRILAAEPDRVGQVHVNAATIATALGVDTPQAAVVSLVLGEPRLTLAVADACHAAGVLVGCFRPPSVPAGGSRLRLTARATLSDTDIKVATTTVLDAIDALR